MRRSDVFALRKAALEGSREPPCTRQLARHVITAEGWDTDDTRLRLAVSHKAGTTMKRTSLRGAVRKVVGAAEGERVAAWAAPRGGPVFESGSRGDALWSLAEA